MSYVKTFWVDGETEITADRLNKLEDGVASASKDSHPFEVGRFYYSPVTYTWPDFYKPEGESKWAKFLAFGKDLGIVILNRNSGNWDSYDADFYKQGMRAKAAGAKRVVFYIKTQYAFATDPEKYQPNSGLSLEDAGKYTHEYILDQVKKCISQYQGLCEGVFLDEYVNGWGEQESRQQWYVDLYRKIKEFAGEDFLIVGNPGSNTTPKMLEAADVLMTFEKSAQAYLTEEYIHPEHYAEEDSYRFWHVVHDVTKDNYQAVFERAKKFGVGHLFVTDRTLDFGSGSQWNPETHPYDNPPSAWIVEHTTAWINGYLDLLNRVIALEAK